MASISVFGGDTRCPFMNHPAAIELMKFHRSIQDFTEVERTYFLRPRELTTDLKTVPKKPIW